MTFFFGVAMVGLGFECPPEIHTKQSASNLPKGWRSFFDSVNERYSLENVRFFDGPPEQLADLVPDDGPSWTFSVPRTRAIWQVCKYGDTAVQIAQALPDSIRTCKVIYEPQTGPKALHTAGGLPVIKRVDCR